MYDQEKISVVLEQRLMQSRMSPFRMASSILLIAAVGGCQDPQAIDRRPATVIVEPAEPVLVEGDTVRLTASILAADGSVLDGVAVSWQSADTLVFQHDSNGLVFGRSSGLATLSVSAGAVQEHVVIRVTPVDTGWRSLGVHCGVWQDAMSYCWHWSEIPGPIATPLPLMGIPRLHGIRSSRHHRCGLTDAGEAYCWGENDYGQLGDGTTTDRPLPVRVAGGLQFDSISVASLHTCAITREQTAYCWGGGKTGQLGVAMPPELCDGTPCSRVPIRVAGELRFVAIAAGSNSDRMPSTTGIGFTCGLSDANQAFCWGWNEVGSVGDATKSDRTVPTPVAGQLRFVAITAGGAHVCALTKDGQAWCWGLNSNGALGVMVPSDCRAGDIFFQCISVPTAVATSERFRALAAAYQNTCGLNRFGAAFCWGTNWQGEVGSGITFPTSALTPTRVVGGHTYLQLTTHYVSTCGLTPKRSVWCWGYQTPYPQPVPDPK